MLYLSLIWIRIFAVGDVNVSPLFVPGAVILRVPILYGEVERVDESAVTVLWNRVQEGAESCTIDHCQQRFPTYCKDVARVCRQMAERRTQVSGFQTPSIDS